MLPQGDCCIVKQDGEQRGERSSTRVEAETAGGGLARMAELGFQLHGQDRPVCENDSYGNDPRDING